MKLVLLCEASTLPVAPLSPEPAPLTTRQLVDLTSSERKNALLCLPSSSYQLFSPLYRSPAPKIAHRDASGEAKFCSIPPSRGWGFELRVSEVGEILLHPAVVVRGSFRKPPLHISCKKRHFHLRAQESVKRGVGGEGDGKGRRDRK